MCVCCVRFLASAAGSMNAECEGRPCEDSKTRHETMRHFIDPLCIFISSVANHKHSYGNTFLENKKKKKVVH